MRTETGNVSIGDYKYGFSYPDISIFKTQKRAGRARSWMRFLTTRANRNGCGSSGSRALRAFRSKAMPNWGADLSEIDFDNIYYYAKPVELQSRNWDDVPDSIKQTFERIGIPEAERKFLAGVGAQYDSEMVYHNIHKDLEKKGVIFCDPETAVREHPDIVKEYFGTVIPFMDNKFAALNSAVWSGGSFVYIPKGVTWTFRFRRISASTAAISGSSSGRSSSPKKDSFRALHRRLHRADLLHGQPAQRGRRDYRETRSARALFDDPELVDNVYNLVTKRAVAYEGATVEWVDGNIGSKRTMKYPSIYLMGEGAHGEVLSIAFAGKGQQQDTGGKMVHAANGTSSVITSKSISKDGGISSYRGLLNVAEGLKGVKFARRLRCAHSG